MIIHDFIINKISRRQKTMFNSHVAQKQLRSQKKVHDEKKKVKSWFKRYHTQVQPELVKNYNKRINGFIKKIEEKPILLHEQKFVDQITRFRIQNKDAYISEKTFRFKDSHDWKSIFNPLERAQRSEKLKYEEKFGDPNLAFRSIGSQSTYQGKKIEYRSRNQSKQINPPMKYTNPNYLRNLKFLPQLQRKHKKLAMKQKEQGNNHSRDSLTNSKDGKDSQIQNVSDLDAISIHNSSLFKRVDEKTEKQKEEQEKLKALAQNRMYFKQLIDLEQNSHENKNKQNIRDLLVKCGVYKKKEKKVMPKVEIDFFLQLLKQQLGDD